MAHGAQWCVCKWSIRVIVVLNRLWWGPVLVLKVEETREMDGVLVWLVLCKQNDFSNYLDIKT